MEQIIHQNHRTLEGFDRPCLNGQTRIAGIFFDDEMVDIVGVGLVHMQTFGHGVGYYFSGQNFAVGHAHIRPQTALPGGNVLHAVAALHSLHQPLIEQFGIKAGDELAGEKSGQRQTQTGTGSFHGLSYGGVTAQRLLKAKHHVLYQHDGRAHIHIVHVAAPRYGAEAKLGQHAHHPVVSQPAQIQGVGVVVLQRAHQKLRQQQSGVFLRLRSGQMHPIYQKNAAGGVPPDEFGSLQIAQSRPQIGSAHRASADPAAKLIAAAHAQSGAVACLRLRSGQFCRNGRGEAHGQLLLLHHLLELRRTQI